MSAGRGVNERGAVSEPGETADARIRDAAAVFTTVMQAATAVVTGVVIADGHWVLAVAGLLAVTASTGVLVAGRLIERGVLILQ